LEEFNHVYLNLLYALGLRLFLAADSNHPYARVSSGYFCLQTLTIHMNQSHLVTSVCRP